ncbi:MAG TPA: HAD-IC family P-type ATPase [Methylomirabilota bacterium]|nr:HAD-IC family P-type ATPase [Methylomirabilota bacterium]
MLRAPAVTSLLAGDPSSSHAPTVAALLAEQGPSEWGAASALTLAPGVALLHALGAGPAALELRWIGLTRAVDGTRAAIVLGGSLRDAGLALHLVGRLRAGLADTARLERALEARTLEELVQALAPLDRASDESSLTASEVLALVGSSPHGLDAAEAERRLATCGTNALEHVRRRPLAMRLLEQLVSFFAVLLWVGGVLALLAGMPELGWAIFAVIVVNGIFSFLQEFRAERAIEALRSLLPREIAVVRDGRPARLPVERIVPGDLVRVTEGDQAPADGRLLESEDLRVDQSAHTGEARAVFKHPGVDGPPALAGVYERPERVFAGTAVVAGAGLYVATATGMASEIGRVAQLTQAVAAGPSPLQREMARVTRIVTAVAVIVGGSFFGLGAATGLLSIADSFVFALGVIVANVPEGLLPTLTLSLALAVQRLARRGALVKRLSAVEALGAATVICTDKTGTLTEGRMVLRAVWVGGGRRAAGTIDATDPDVRSLFEAAVLASQATADHGDPTEVALVAAAAGLGIDAADLRETRPVRAAYAFDSFRKRMTLVRAVGADAVAHVKGAPRETLVLCDHVRIAGPRCRSTPRGARRSWPTTTGSLPRDSGCWRSRRDRCHARTWVRRRGGSSAGSRCSGSWRCGTRRVARCRTPSPSARARASGSWS